MTVKMQKGDVIADINDSAESIAHAYSMGYHPVDQKKTDAALKADLQNGPAQTGPSNPGQSDKPGNPGPAAPSQDNPGPAQPNAEQPGPAAPAPESPGPEQPGKPDKPGKSEKSGLFGGKKDNSQGA